MESPCCQFIQFLLNTEAFSAQIKEPVIDADAEFPEYVQPDNHIAKRVDVPGIKHEVPEQSNISAPEFFPSFQMIEKRAVCFSGDFAGYIHIYGEIVRPAFFSMGKFFNIESVVGLQYNAAVIECGNPADQFGEIAVEFFGRNAASRIAVITADREDYDIRLEKSAVSVEPVQNVSRRIAAHTRIDTDMFPSVMFPYAHFEPVEPVMAAFAVIGQFGI